MRILWLTRQDPRPADSGELIYSHGLLRAVANAGASITVLCHRQDSEEAGETDAAHTPSWIEWAPQGTIPQGRAASLLSRLPSDAYRLGNRAMRKALRECYRGAAWDAVVVDQAAMGWVLDEIPRAGSPPIVYVSHNREAEIRRQIARSYEGNPVRKAAVFLDAMKYGALERRLCQRADLITAITPEDRDAYAGQHPTTEVIDLMPGYEREIPVRRKEPIGPTTSRRVLLVGSFEWIAKRHNLLKLLDVADPAFQRAGIELQIVGKASTDFVTQIRRNYPSTDFAPNVASIEPYLQDARLGLIAETVGGGFKLKTLEYAFAFLPIAALKNAIGGVSLEADHDAIVESDLESLVQKIVDRIGDFDFLNTAALRTRNKLAADFRWPDRGRAFLDAVAKHSGQCAAGAAPAFPAAPLPGAVTEAERA